MLQIKLCSTRTTVTLTPLPLCSLVESCVFLTPCEEVRGGHHELWSWNSYNSLWRPRVLFSFHRTQCRCTWTPSGLNAGLRVCKGKTYSCVTRPPMLWCAGQKLWTENPHLKLFCCIKGLKKDFPPPEQTGPFESTSSPLLNTSEHFDLWSTIRDTC